MFRYVVAALAVVVALLGCSSDRQNSTANESGWAIAQEADAKTACILHTNDHGTTWVRQGNPDQLGNLEPADISAADHKTAWFCGVRNGTTSVMLATTDGGATWVSQTLPSDSRTLSGVRAVNQSVAWAVGRGGLVLRTIDGGAHWEDHSINSDPNIFVARVTAQDADNAIIGGSIGGTKLFIKYTTDGGKSWQDPDSVPANWSIIIDLHWVPGAKTVWAVGDDRIDGGPIVQSDDGGRTWQYRGPFVPDLHSNGVFAADPDTAWVGCDYGAVRHTENHGKDWQDQTIPVQGVWIGGISALTAKEAWMGGFVANAETAAGQKGYVFHTTNGGNTWESQSIPSVLRLWRITFAKMR